LGSAAKNLRLLRGGRPPVRGSRPGGRDRPTSGEHTLQQHRSGTPPANLPGPATLVRHEAAGEGVHPAPPGRGADLPDAGGREGFTTAAPVGRGTRREAVGRLPQRLGRSGGRSTPTTPSPGLDAPARRRGTCGGPESNGTGQTRPRRRDGRAHRAG